MASTLVDGRLVLGIISYLWMEILFAVERREEGKKSNRKPHCSRKQSIDEDRFVNEKKKEK